MAQKAKPGDGQVTNLTDTKDLVKNVVPAIINLKSQRKAINEQIAEQRARVEAAGVPKKALDHAIRIREMDPDDREKFDEGYAIARDAIGLPVSRSLFDMLDERLDAEGKAADGKKPKGDALAAARAHLAGNEAPAPDAVTA
jgi:uncharacterized protein (UPF0335 family)